VWELPERGPLLEPTKELVPTWRVICGTTPVDVKINCGLNTKCLVRNPKPAGENPEKTGKKT